MPLTVHKTTLVVAVVALLPLVQTQTALLVRLAMEVLELRHQLQVLQ
jgi:hypothetical protein